MKLMTYLLIGYMWLFIHRPFEIWPWLGVLRVEFVYMLITLVYWVIAVRKTWTRNQINGAIVFLLISILLSTLFSRYTSISESIELQNWLKLLVFYILVVSSVKNERQLRILIVAFVVIVGIYELHSLREYMNGRGEYRMGMWRMIGVDDSLGEPNSFSASCNYALPMLLPVLTLANQKKQWLALFGLFILGSVCIFLAGSRTGFAGFALLVIGGGLLSKYRWKILPLLIVVPILVWVNLPDNLKNRYSTLVDSSKGPKNAQESADSRKKLFNISLDVWKKNPIVGVGPGCFSIVSRTGLQAHTLYGQTISELGAVGAIAVLVLISSFFANFREGLRISKLKESDFETKFCTSVLLACSITVVQLLFFGLGGHNLFRFTWIWYGAFSVVALRLLREQRDNSYCEETEILNPWHEVLN